MGSGHAGGEEMETTAYSLTTSDSKGYLITKTFGAKKEHDDCARIVGKSQWPARYFVPDALRDYCMFDASSSGCGDG